MQTLRSLQLLATVVLLVSLYSNDKFIAMAQLYQDVDLEFEADGTTHSETVHVSDGGDHVLYTDIIDGFEVLLIHEKGLVLMKNMTSAECFFAPLDNLPPTTMRGKFRPIYLTTDTESTASINFHKGNLIPDQFLQAALGPGIGSHCFHLPSYWLEKDEENPKEKEKRFFFIFGIIFINIFW